MDISIIVPVYNAQKSIAACLRSITRCSDENIEMECIVVNNGSEDDTASIVKRYIQRDSRIRLADSHNSDMSDAVNKGIAEAEGRYIMFLNADDCLCEDAWEHIEAAVEENYADFMAFSYIELYKNGRLKAKMLPIKEVVSTDENEARKLMETGTVLNTCWSKLFKSEIIKNNNIAFKAGQDLNGEALFTADYAGFCNSFMMTRAMILYHFQEKEKKTFHLFNMFNHFAANTICILAAALLLGGCGKNAETDNIEAGMKLIEEYNFNEALENFELALANNEDMELCYRGQGIAYMGLGEYGQAQEAFLKSIENAGGRLTGLEYDTNYYLAASYMRQGKYAEAEEIYSAITALRKKELDAYYLRACAVLRQGRYDEAVADFEKSFTLEPDNLELVTDAYVEMEAAGFGEEGKAYLRKFMQEKDKQLTDGEKGVIYYYLDDYENARIYLDAFVNGNDADMSLILGQTYEKLGDMNYAAVVYQTYLDSNVPDAALYNNLGMCLMNQKKYDEALDVFQAGMDMGNSDYIQELKFNIIVANEYMGNFDAAKTLMKEYLTIYPDDEKAKKENDFLQTR